MKQRISATQFYALLTLFILSSDFIRGMYCKELKNDVWIATLIGTVISVILFTLYIFIYKNNQFDSFDNAIKHSLGKVISRIIYIIYIPYFLSIVFFTMTDINDIVQNNLLQDYKGYILTAIFLFAVGYLLLKQLEVVARVAIIIFILFIIIFISMLILTSALYDYEYSNILPILNNGFKHLIKPSLQMGYSIPFGQIFVMTIIYDNIEKKERHTKIGNFGILTASFILVVINFLNIFILGPIAMTIGTSPAFRIARVIDVEEYIQRLDLILMAFHTILIFIKAFILLYGAGEMVKGIVKINPKKMNIVYLIMVLVVYFTVFFVTKEYSKILIFRLKYFISYVCLVTEVLIPLIIVIASFIKKNKRKIKPDEILDYAI